MCCYMNSRCWCLIFLHTFPACDIYIPLLSSLFPSGCPRMIAYMRTIIVCFYWLLCQIVLHLLPIFVPSLWYSACVPTISCSGSDINGVPSDCWSRIWFAIEIFPLHFFVSEKFGQGPIRIRYIDFIHTFHPALSLAHLAQSQSSLLWMWKWTNRSGKVQDNKRVE